MMTSVYDPEDVQLLMQEEHHRCPRMNRKLHWLAMTLTAVLLFPYAIFLATTASQNDGTFLRRQLALFVLSGITFASSMRAMFQRTPIPKFESDPRRGTWFGHLMSQEGERDDIPVVLCATYSFVFCYGAVASLVTGCPLLCIPTFYIFGLIIFYLWHMAAHVWKGSELNRIHMLHHHERYPREDFYGDNHVVVQNKRSLRGGRAATLLELMNPQSSTTMAWAHEGPLFVGIAGILGLARFLMGLSLGTCGFVLAGLVFMGTFGSALHISFHERDFELEPYAFYRELRSLHMIHHMHRKNFAMVNVMLDLVFCSLMLSE